MIDLRILRPLDDETILASVARTRRAVIVDEGWRSGSLSAEIAARIVEARLLASRCADWPGLLGRSADPLSQAPGRRSTAAGAQASSPPRRPRSERLRMADFLMPSLGADMEAGKLVEWLVKPGDRGQTRRHRRGRRNPEGRHRDRGLRSRNRRDAESQDRRDPAGRRPAGGDPRTGHGDGENGPRETPEIRKNRRGFSAGPNARLTPTRAGRGRRRGLARRARPGV